MQKIFQILFIKYLSIHLIKYLILFSFNHKYINYKNYLLNTILSTLCNPIYTKLDRIQYFNFDNLTNQNIKSLQTKILLNKQEIDTFKFNILNENVKILKWIEQINKNIFQKNWLEYINKKDLILSKFLKMSEKQSIQSVKNLLYISQYIINNWKDNNKEIIKKNQLKIKGDNVILTVNELKQSIYSQLKLTNCYINRNKEYKGQIKDKLSITIGIQAPKWQIESNYYKALIKKKSKINKWSYMLGYNEQRNKNIEKYLKWKREAHFIKTQKNYEKINILSKNMEYQVIKPLNDKYLFFDKKIKPFDTKNVEYIDMSKPKKILKNTYGNCLPEIKENPKFNLTNAIINDKKIKILLKKKRIDQEIKRIEKKQKFGMKTNMYYKNNIVLKGLIKEKSDLTKPWDEKTKIILKYGYCKSENAFLFVQNLSKYLISYLKKHKGSKNKAQQLKKIAHQMLLSIYTKNKHKFNGIGFRFSGRVYGAKKAASFKMLFGSVPLSTLSAKINFAQITEKTINGTWGFKTWLNIKKRDKLNLYRLVSNKN